MVVLLLGREGLATLADVHVRRDTLRSSILIQRNILRIDDTGILYLLWYLEYIICNARSYLVMLEVIFYTEMV